jgi:hypothetical protein
VPDYGALASAAQLIPADTERLARRLYRVKAAEYRATLLALGKRYGVEQSRVVLSAEIRDALQSEATRGAEQAIATYNRLVSDFVKRKRNLPTAQLVVQLTDYMRERAEVRPRVITDAAKITPRLDAQVAFFRENGVDPEFDFEGKAPNCQTCRALMATSPHPIEIVLEVGNPHLGCVHRWVPRAVGRAELREGGVRPGKISLGRGEPAGIVGSRPFTNREGGHVAAADRIFEVAPLRILESTVDPDRNDVALSTHSWGHILGEHHEMRDRRTEIMDVVAHPDAKTRDRSGPSKVHFWKRGTGPSDWLRVSVKYVAGNRGYITTAHGHRRGPGQ